MLRFTTYGTAPIIYTFYQHRREMSDLLDSFNAELNQSQFFRMFALGSLDTFITLPIAIIDMVANIIANIPEFSFYQGWSFIHSDWGIFLIPKSTWSTSKWGVASVHWNEWIGPFFALIFFALFGLTPEARKGYCKLFRLITGPYGAMRERNTTEEEFKDIVFKRETSATIMSSISFRCDLIIH